MPEIRKCHFKVFGGIHWRNIAGVGVRGYRQYKCNECGRVVAFWLCGSSGDESLKPKGD